jgi:tRNA(fMet)-specific endonuclease VapC
VGLSLLLDSNTCVHYLRRRGSPVAARLMATPPEVIFLCSIVKSELQYGALRSNDPAKALGALGEFFGQFLSFPFDDQAAVEAGRIRAELATRGTPIGANDLLIAAIAIANDLTLVTHNTREFQRVPGLKWEDWEASQA